MSRMRWWVLTLVFCATTINYLDRIVFSVLMPVIRQDLGFNDQQYGYITGAFSVSYMVGFLIAGKMIDRFGTRIGYAASIVWWSISAALHSTVGSVVQLGFWRFMLGLGEAGNFPAAVKSVTEWFPKKDRAFATGIFNAGTNVASMIGPAMFVWINLRYGWRPAFLVTAVLSALWVILWLTTYKQPPVQDDEAGKPQQNIGWLAALRYPQTWGFALGKFLTDPVWWFYLYWLPPYLYDVRKFNLKEIAWALPVVYIMADIGSVLGGWFPGWLMRRGWDAGRARRAAMLICAFCMPVAALASVAVSPILAVALISLATAAHQGWSANLFTTTSDFFPKGAVASVTGVGGSAGGLGGLIFSTVGAGFIVSHFGYTPMILFMGVLHLTAFVTMKALIWRQERA